VNQSKIVRGYVEMERERLEELPVLRIEAFGQPPLALLELDFDAAPPRIAPAQKNVVVVAANAARAGASNEREHPFWIRAAGDQITQKIERVVGAEPQKLEQSFGFLAAPVNVADDDGSS
jgi:hypothetical protein